MKSVNCHLMCFECSIPLHFPFFIWRFLKYRYPLTRNNHNIISYIHVYIYIKFYSLKVNIYCKIIVLIHTCINRLRHAFRYLVIKY